MPSAEDHVDAMRTIAANVEAVVQSDDGRAAEYQTSLRRNLQELGVPAPFACRCSVTGAGYDPAHDSPLFSDDTCFFDVTCPRLPDLAFAVRVEAAPNIIETSTLALAHQIITLVFACHMGHLDIGRDTR